MTSQLVRNTVLDSAQKPVPNSQVRIYLISGPAGAALDANTQASLGSPHVPSTNRVGYWGVPLQPNVGAGAITNPAGTYYRVVEPNGASWTIQINGDLTPPVDGWWVGDPAILAQDPAAPGAVQVGVSQASLTAQLGDYVPVPTGATPGAVAVVDSDGSTIRFDGTALSTTSGDGRYTKRALHAATSANTQRFMRKLQRGVEDAALLVISDSTAAITTRWVYLAAQQIAAAFPAWTVIYHLWDPTGGAAYDTGTAGTPTTIQTGTGARTLHVWNFSVSGKQTSYGLAARYAAAVEAVTPDLVVISHGKNEQTPTGVLATDQALWRGQMLALAERVTMTHPQAGVLLTLQHRNTLAVDANSNMAKRNRIYEEVAAMRGFGLVNVFDAFEDTGHPEDFIRADGIHPTDATDPAAPAPGPGQTTPARDGAALWTLTFMSALTYDAIGAVPAQQESSLVQISDQLLPNGDFAAWTTGPTSWTLNGCTVSKDTRSGWFESTNGYAARIQATGAAQSFIDQFIPNPTFYKNKWVTLRVRGRVAASAMTSTSFRVGLSDGVQTTALSYAKTDAVDGFFDQIVSLKMSSSATYLRVLIYADSGTNASADVTIDHAYLVRGLLPRKGSSGAQGVAGPTGPAYATFDHLSTISNNNPVATLAASTQFVLGGANQAILVPIKPQRDCSIGVLNWMPGVVSGNYDIGIYDNSGTKLWSKGSTAVTSGVKTETVSPAVALTANTQYWVAITFDNTTAQVYGISSVVANLGLLLGGTAHARTVSSSFPLPSTITFGSVGSSKIPAIVLRES